MREKIYVDYLSLFGKLPPDDIRQVAWKTQWNLYFYIKDLCDPRDSVEPRRYIQPKRRCI